MSRMEERRDLEVREGHSHSPRELRALVVGGIGAVVGNIAAGIYLTNKLIPFDREVAGRTRQDILARGGLGAGIAESGGFVQGGGNHIIEEAHALELIQKPEYSFAKRVRQLGGRSTVSLFTAIGAGLATATAYLAFAPKREQQTVQIVLPSHAAVNDAAENNNASQQHAKWQENIKKEAEQKEAVLGSNGRA